MNNLTKICFNVLQRIKLDTVLIRASKNRWLCPRLLHYGWSNRNAQSYQEQYARWQEKLARQNIVFTNKRILDVGSGGSFGLAYFFLPQRFYLWTSSDYYHNLGNDRRVIKRERRLVTDLEARFGRPLAPAVVRQGSNLIFKEQFRFIPLEITEFNESLVEQYDVILSSAVLEHIPRLAMERSFSNLTGYLKPGGIMVHEIDMRDHVNVVNPFDFLRFSAEEWEARTGGTIFYTNRLRTKDYLGLFHRFNLQVLFTETEQASLPPPNRIHECFKGYTFAELAIARLFIIVKKPENCV